MFVIRRVLKLLVLAPTWVWAQVPFFSNDVITTPNTFYHNGDFTANASVQFTDGATPVVITGSATFNAFRSNDGDITIGGDINGTSNEADINFSSFGEVILNGAGPQTIRGLCVLGYDLRISNATGPIQIDANSRLVVRDILEFGSRIDVDPTGALFLSTPPAVQTDPGDALHFVNGPLEVSESSLGAPATRGLPYLGIGGLALFEPMSISVERLIAGPDDGAIRISAVAGGTGGVGAVGTRFQRLSTDRYLRFTTAAPFRPNSVRISQITLDYNGESNIPVALHARLGMKQTDANPVGDYTPLPTILNDDVNRLLTVALDDTVGNNPAKPDLFLTFGVAKVEAGTITSVVPPATVPNVETVICPGDTVELSLTGADAGTIQWEDSVALGAAFFASVGGSATGLNSDAIGRERTYRVIASDGPTFEPDTSNLFFVDLAPAVYISASAFLEGPYVDGTTSMNAYPVPAELQTYFTSRGTLDSNLYPGATVPANAVDVVELQLWYSLAPNDTVEGSRTLGWLLSDGTVVHFQSGNPALPVYSCDGGVTVLPGDYHVAIRHRNHLPLITAAPITFVDGVATAVDFTNYGLIYTWLPAIQEGARRFPIDGTAALFAANVTDEATVNPQFVNSLDYSRVFVANGILIGYVQEDVNCDGVVNAADVTLVQTNNDQLKYSNVPDEF